MGLVTCGVFHFRDISIRKAFSFAEGTRQLYPIVSFRTLREKRSHQLPFLVCRGNDHSSVFCHDGITLHASSTWWSCTATFLIDRCDQQCYPAQAQDDWLAILLGKRGTFFSPIQKKVTSKFVSAVLGPEDSPLICLSLSTLLNVEYQCRSVVVFSQLAPTAKRSSIQIVDTSSLKNTNLMCFTYNPLGNFVNGK